MRLPYLYSRDWQQVCPLHPSELSAEMQLTPPSVLSMVIPFGQDVPRVRDWIRYDIAGKLCFWRVTSVTDTYQDSVTVEAEHGITSLSDYATGNKEKLTGTLRQVVERLLAFQTEQLWVLGACPDVEAISIEGSFAEILRNLLSITNKYVLTFDQSVKPWVININMPETVASCEARISRNMLGVSITEDDTELCTRVMHEKLPDGHLDADTIGKYGVVQKAFAPKDQSKIEQECREYLEENKEPAFEIEMDALLLSDLTGESLDRFELGKLCRINLPERTITQRITAMQYSDLLNAPEQATLTIAKASATVSGSLGMMTQNIRTAYGNIDDVLHKTEQYYQWTGDRLQTIKNEVQIDLDAANARIDLKASQTTVDAINNRVNEAEIKIDGAKAEIELKVSSNDIVSSINMSPEEITIKASKINLSGYAKVSQLEAATASIENLLTGTTVASHLHASLVTATSLVVGGKRYVERPIATLDGIQLKVLSSL